jgi:transcription-repair coupling factor (superfamily II helicase)
MNDLREKAAMKFDINLLVSNPKQVERFYAIFDDLKADFQYTPTVIAIYSGFIDYDLKLVCYTDHQIFDRFYKYQMKQGYSKDKALTIKMLRDLQPGDYVTHIDHGIGVFSV